jgi:hypothetical protein
MTLNAPHNSPNFAAAHESGYGPFCDLARFPLFGRFFSNRPFGVKHFILRAACAAGSSFAMSNGWPGTRPMPGSHRRRYAGLSAFKALRPLIRISEPLESPLATHGGIMSRFIVAAFIGAIIAAAVSTSASAWHCMASSPNGAVGTAFGVIIERAQSIAMRRCIFRGGGAGCHIAYCRPY